MLLKDKVAAITGASRGIGRAIVDKFAENGAKLAIISRSDTIFEVEKELKENGYDVKAYQLDVSDYEKTQQVAKQIIEDFGQVDILVNNAGITRDTLVLRMSEEDWDKVIQVNLKSVFNMTKAFLPSMVRKRSGVIVNMSSVVGRGGNAGQANYAASKAGVIGFTKSIAKEYGNRNIRANVVAPGFILTDMTKDLPEKVVQEYIANIPLRRQGKPGEVADVVLFLASDMAAYITGQVINVCGGLDI